MKIINNAEGPATRTRQGVLPFTANRDRVSRAGRRYFSTEFREERPRNDAGLVPADAVCQRPVQGPELAAEDWTHVVGKLKAVDKVESKTYVIWGVPQSNLAARVHESVERASGPLYNKFYWRGDGTSRHIAAEFHITPDIFRANALMSACKSLGWKAIPARRWKHRCLHRASRKRDRSSKGPVFTVENRFEILAPQDEPTNPLQDSKTSKARTQKPAETFKVGSFNVEKGLNDKVGELEEFVLTHRYDAVAVQEADLKKGKAPAPMKGSLRSQPRAPSCSHRSYGMSVVLSRRLSPSRCRPPRTSYGSG